MLEHLEEKIRTVWDDQDIPAPSDVLTFVQPTTTQLTPEIKKMLGREDEDLVDAFLGKRYDQVSPTTFISWGAFGSPLIYLSARARSYYLGAIALCLIKDILPRKDLDDISRVTANLNEAVGLVTGTQSSLTGDQATILIEVLQELADYWGRQGQIFMTDFEGQTRTSISELERYVGKS